MKRVVAFALTTTALFAASEARAGGLEMPDNGTEALGRGAAFVAKADDPTAIHHNVAGLAQQRGTRALVNANVGRSSLAFQRAGVYPGEQGSTPYAGQPYPKAENQGGVFVLPFLALSSDFGLKKTTFSLGSFPPPVAGGRLYPLNVNGRPSPVRYDAVGGKSSIMLFHTAAVGVRVENWLDLGAAVHVVQADLGLRAISYIDLIDVCKQYALENPACDARAEINVKAWSGTGSVGAIARPDQSIAIGAHIRGPVYLVGQGEATFTAPDAAKALKLPPSRVAFKTQLPWMFKAGVRKQFGPPYREKGDVELDATYEMWGAALNPGHEVVLEKVGPLKGPQKETVQLNYSDTFSIRAGGSYTTYAAGPAIVLRGGMFYDASATSTQYTKLDTDTLQKVAFTAGLGVKLASAKIDFAYASVFDVPRTVTNGASKPTDDAGAPVVNNGVFTGHTHIASLGITFELDVLIKSIPSLPSVTRGEKVASR